MPRALLPCLGCKQILRAQPDARWTDMLGKTLCPTTGIPHRPYRKGSSCRMFGGRPVGPIGGQVRVICTCGDWQSTEADPDGDLTKIVEEWEAHVQARQAAVAELTGTPAQR